MSSTETIDNSRWYAIRTHINQENRAEANLRAWNVPIFFPKIKEQRRNEFSGAITNLTKPLFSCYIFARFDVQKLMHKVCFTRGVQSVVSFGGMPSAVDDSIIELLQSRAGDDGFVRIGEELKPGDKVIMKGGVLDNFVGIFERTTNDSDRVMILLQTINYQGHIIVERDAIRKVVR